MDKAKWIIAALVGVVILIMTGTVANKNEQERKNALSTLEMRINALDKQQAMLVTTCADLTSNDVAMANGMTSALKAYAKVIVENKNSHIILSNTFKEYYGQKKWLRMLKEGTPPPTPSKTAPVVPQKVHVKE